MTDDLIARLCAATEGSRELDAEIELRRIGRWEQADRNTDGSLRWSAAGTEVLFHAPPLKWSESWVPVPRYTTSVDAAIRLVPENRMWFVGHLDPTDMRFAATISCGHVGSLEWRAIHRSAPLAIVIASLRARAAG